MEYIRVADARARRGLRLVLTAGVPGPWGEAAKSVLHVDGVPYVAVAQLGGMANEDLVAWTGHANAPVAVYDDEAPRTGWAEILLLAERLSPAPRLLPADAFDRALVFGLGHEICGEGGFGWSRRLMLIDALHAPGVPDAMRHVGEVLGARYGYSKEAAVAAPARVASILAMLASRMKEQKARGSDYLVGPSLTAADVWWAAFSVLVRPLEGELCPLPDNLRAWYLDVGETVAAALDPVLLEHRDRVYRDHLVLPMSF